MVRCARALLWMTGLCLSLIASAQTATEVRVDSLDAAVKLPGYWFPAQNGPAPRPAVVALHGCDGLLDPKGRLSAGRLRYARLLNEAGIGVLFTESFVPRGETSICSQKGSVRRITEEDRRLDVYGALQWLAGQEGVDGRRLGVVGWSHGGQTVLSSADLSSEVVSGAAVKPAALVAFYPGCDKVLKRFRYAVAAPTLVMSGALDDWTPPAPCRRLTSGLQGDVGKPVVQYLEFADSYHAFDSSLPPRERSDVGGTRSGKATVGGNPVAREESACAMVSFLKTHLAK